MNFKFTPGLWIVAALFLFTFGVAYVSSLQQPVCIDPQMKPGVWDLTAWPIKVAFFQLLAVFGLLAFTLSRRFVATRPPDEPVRTQGEYVASMGSLLQRAGQRSAITETLARQFQQELARKLGLPQTASQIEILRMLKTAHPKIASRVEVIFDDSTRLQSPGHERDVMGMIRWGRDIAAIRREWRSGR